MIVALFTIVYGVWSLRATAQSQFETKVAELAMTGPDPDAARNRARILANWFQESLPRNINNRLENFKPEDFGIVGDPAFESKKEVFNMIVAHPERREEILKTWGALFPGDDWVKSLKVLSSTKASNVRRNHTKSSSLKLDNLCTGQMAEVVSSALARRASLSVLRSPYSARQCTALSRIVKRATYLRPTFAAGTLFPRSSTTPLSFDPLSERAVICDSKARASLLQPA